MRRALPACLLALAACAMGTAASTSPAPSQAGTVPAAPAQPPAPPPDPDAPLKAEVGALRESATGLLAAQAELVWKNWALGEPVDYAAALKGHEALYAPESLQKVRVLRAKVGPKDPAQDRALRALELYLASEQIARATSDASDAVAHLAAASTLSVEGPEIPFRDLEGVLAGEGHVGNRRKLYAAADPVVRKLSAALLQREKKLTAAVAAAGYGDILGWEVALRRVANSEALAALAEQVLARTEASYRAAMEERCKKELGLALADVRRADVPRLLRTGDVDTYFPKENQVAMLTTALERMGLGPAALPQLTVDGKPQPRRSPRALAVSFAAGKDVRLSLRPASGLTAAAQTFHEAGHAVQAAAAREAPELALLGPGAVGEAAGQLFEDLLDDPGFAEALGIPAGKLAAHAKASALRKLLLVRRLAARLLFELSWRAGNVKDPPEEAYRAAMSRALLFPAQPEDGARWLTDNEDLLAPADALRGMLAAAQLRDALAAAFGPRWWAQAEAGGRISAWFGPGSQLSADELVQAAGAKALEVEPLAAGLEALLTGKVAPAPVPATKDSAP